MTAVAEAPRFDLPVIEEDSKPFWDAARERRLLIRRCGDCGDAHFYPRSFCPFCWSERVQWEEASGQASLYTHSTVYRNDLPPFGERVPYVAAMVDLREGPRMTTEVIDVDGADLEIGMALEAAFRDLTDEITAVVFRPTGPGTGR